MIRCPVRLRRAMPLLLAAILLPAAHGLVLAASLTGKVDHDFLSTHETVDFVLSLAGGSDGREPPDVSALARDFEIINRDRRSRSEVVDGKPVEVEEWAMTLAPRHAGVLTIPGLSVDGLTSAPVQVKVVPGLAADEPGDRPMFVRLDAGDVAAYAQGLVPVVVRIYDSIGMQRGSMGQITADGAVFTPQGGQRVYGRTIGKRRYGIIEQSFLMQPQKSGRIQVDPVPVEAMIPGRPSAADSGIASLLGRSAFSPEPLQQVQLKSRPLAIDVKPRPGGAEGWFLPAQGVSLTQEWSASPQKARVGVALTRTVRLKARGASPNQLPELAIGEVEGLRQYEEASRSERVTIDGETGAELVKTIVVVPTRAGRFALPAMTVGWWNTTLGRQDHATLPETILDVMADAASAAAIPAPAVPVPPDPVQEPARGFASSGVPQALQRYGLPLAGIGALLLAGWLLARRVGRRRGAARAPSVPPAGLLRAAQGGGAPAPGDVASAERALLMACRANDAREAHLAALAWLRLSAREGGATARTVPMADALAELNLALYGVSAGLWRGRNLRVAFRGEKRSRLRLPRSARTARVAPLYPTR